MSNLAPQVTPAPEVDRADGHQHQWEHRPHQSGFSVTRYQCATCRCWARRVWPHRGSVPSLQVYPLALIKPRPEWGTDDSYQVRIVPKPPRYRDDPENPTEWTPPTRLWSW